jgi:hypothetical protein
LDGSGLQPQYDAIFLLSVLTMSLIRKAFKRLHYPVDIIANVFDGTWLIP